MREKLIAALIASVVLGTLGCGAATSSVVTNVTPFPPGDEHPTMPPSVVAHWNDALARYQDAVAQEFTPESCVAAIEAFHQADEEQGGSFTEAIYMIAVTHDRCGETEQARTYYTRALELDEHLCGARVALALEHRRSGRLDEARRELERSVHDDPRCTEGYVNLAILQRASPEEEGAALANLRRALAVDATYLPAFNQMALLYLSQGRRRGDPSSAELALAEVVCQQAQLVDADYAPIYNTWGLVQVAEENIVGALAKFERAFTLDDTSFEAYMNFGELTLSFRGYEDAARAFTRATELRSTSYDAWLGLGAARRGLGDPDGAQAAYERAIAIDDARPEAHFNLGVLDQDHRDGSEATLERALVHYRAFVVRAGASSAFADAVTSVTHECAASVGSSRRRRASTCAMGRMQQIEESLILQRTMGATTTTPEGESSP